MICIEIAPKRVRYRNVSERHRNVAKLLLFIYIFFPTDLPIGGVENRIVPEPINEPEQTVSKAVLQNIRISAVGIDLL